jgi:pimeloyl-ACP methyl ester carboxylesterase
MRVSLGLCALLLVGCADDGGVSAYFAVPGSTTGDDFYALPYPNDLWRHDDGSLDLSELPTNSVIAQTVRDIAQRDLDGFGLSSAIFARFSGALDPATLPSPAESMEAGASVYLVDVDPDSPDRGSRVPIVTTFHAEGTQTIGVNRLAVRPFPGFPLADGTTYALVITSRVRALGGGNVTAQSDWSAVAADGGGDTLARAREVYAPLMAWLDEAGDDERADVVSAAVFTTQHATPIVPAIRKAVFGTPAPVARDVITAGVLGNYTVFNGNYDAPNLQVGDPPYITSGGQIEVGTDGAAIVQRMEPMRFALTVPNIAVPASGLPICIYQHGTGGDWKSFIDDGTAERLAAEGIAVISTDQVLHGPRDPSGTDPSIAFFNFNNPVAARDNPLQGAADAWSQMRLALGLSITEGMQTIHFDPDRVFFFGHSQGGLTGPGFVAFEPALKGAVLSGTGGVFYLSVLNKTEPVNFRDLIETLIRDEPLDEDNPTLALAQMMIERSDAVNYAQFMVRRLQTAPDGSQLAPRNVFHTEGFTDHYTPNQAIEAFATSLGGDLVELPDAVQLDGLTLRGRSIKAPPITDNVDGVTAVTAQYQQAGTSDGHFVVFDVGAAKTQSSKFLGTLAATGQATVVSP